MAKSAGLTLHWRWLRRSTCRNFLGYRIAHLSALLIVIYRYKTYAGESARFEAASQIHMGRPLLNRGRRLGFQYGEEGMDRQILDGLADRPGAFDARAGRGTALQPPITITRYQRDSRRLAAGSHVDSERWFPRGETGQAGAAADIRGRFGIGSIDYAGANRVPLARKTTWPVRTHHSGTPRCRSCFSRLRATAG